MSGKIDRYVCILAGRLLGRWVLTHVCLYVDR